MCAHLQLNASQTGEYIASLTRAIAEYPYRMDPSALACVTKIAVAKAKAPASGAAAAAAAGDFDDEDGGGGPPKRKMTKKTSSDTWVAQLQMIPRVSAKIAGAIAARYPTFRSLCDEYASPRLTTVQKMSLLEVCDGVLLLVAIVGVAPLSFILSTVYDVCYLRRSFF